MSTIQHFELPRPIYPGAPEPAGSPVPAPVAAVAFPPPAPVIPAAPVPPPPTRAWWKTRAARITAGVVGGLLLASAAHAAGQSGEGSGRREVAVNPGGGSGGSVETAEVGVEVEAAAVALVGSGASAGEVSCVAGELSGEPNLVASLQGGATVLPYDEATVAADVVVGCVAPETIAAALTAAPELAELDGEQLACVQEQILYLDSSSLAEYLALGLSGDPGLAEMSGEIFGVCSY